jgi:hypothetical protein
MATILNKVQGGAQGVGNVASNISNLATGGLVGAPPAGSGKWSTTKKVGVGFVILVILVGIIVFIVWATGGFAPAEPYYYENMRMYDNLGPGFGRRDPKDTSRAPLQEGFEIPAPVGNRQMDESLPSAVSVLNDPRFHTVTKTLLSTQNRIGENIQVRNPTTDIRGSVPVFTSGPGTLFNQQLSRSQFSDTLA